LRIGFAFLAAIQSGCFPGCRALQKVQPKEWKEGEKSDSVFSTSPPFFGHPISFLRIVFAFLAAIQSGCLAQLSHETKKHPILFNTTKDHLITCIPKK
jgi:hypothetical protein